jgi:hypothetical protein
MSVFRSPRLILPPREEDEVYPYRRVWRSVLIEGSILAVVLVGLYGALGLVGLNIPTALVGPLNAVLVLLPALLWGYFSWLQEMTVPQPRRQLGAVFALAALVASAVGVPLVNEFLQPDQWLSLDSAVNRIIGYTVTTGITQEFIKYFLTRSVVRADLYRVRTDVLAYSLAVAVGYSTMLSIQFLRATPDAQPDMLMLRVVTIYAMHLAGSAVLSYGLMELYLGSGSIFLLPATLVIAAAITGVALPLRSGLVNTQIALHNAAGALSTTYPPRALYGVGFALALLAVPQVLVAFLYDVSERRERDRLRGD